MRFPRVARFAVPATALVVASLFLSLTRAEADGAPKNTYPRCILIIRHAEKTGEKDDAHLSKQGKERAEVLDQLFVASKGRTDPFPTPDFIFAATSHKNSQRPVETVTPLAKKLKLTINDKFDSQVAKDGKEKPKEGMAELRDELFHSPKYQGKTVLISWRHGTLPELAVTFKVKAPEKWEDEVFDRVWQIDFDKEGKPTFRDRPQRLLPKDSVK